MHDIVVIVSVVTGLGAIGALAAAGWHTWRLEWLRHHADRRTDA